MTLRLPDVECAFFFAALAQLEPALRPVFAERVAAILQSHRDPGVGDCDRAVRQALVGLWVPPEFNEQRGSRWDRDPSGSRRAPDKPARAGSKRPDRPLLAMLGSRRRVELSQRDIEPVPNRWRSPKGTQT